MRKLTLLITTLFLSLGMAWAQTFEISTNVGNPEHQYLIKNGNDIWMAANTAPTQNNKAYFAFFEADGDDAYKIYSVGEQKWVSYDKMSTTDNTKGFASLVDSKDNANAWKITATTINGGKSGFNVQPFNKDGTVSNRYWNWNAGVGNGGGYGYTYDDSKTVGLWRQNAATDAGSGWVLLQEGGYYITDAAGNVFEGEDPIVNGQVDGFTLKNVVWDGTKYTATINFPFPVSKEGGVINMTTIASAADAKKWCATDDAVIMVQTSGYDANDNDWLWAIYPQFANGAFSFKIKSIGKDKWIYTNASGSKVDGTNNNESADGAAGAVQLTNEGTSFDVVKSNSVVAFHYMAGNSNQYLSINSKNDTKVFLGVHTGIHVGTDCYFYKVKTVTPVAQIDNKGYYTLQAAFNAVQDGETIKLVDNVTISAATAGYTDGEYTDGVRYTGDKSFTVDFNGKTVTDDGCVNDYLIYVNNKGEKASEITFTNGTIVSANGCWSAVCVNSSAATQNVVLNLNGMNITNSNDAVYSGNPVVRVRTLATVNVNDGTIITSNGASYGVAANTDGSIVNINEGATIVQQNSGTTGGNSVFAAVGGKGVINIKGGTITSDRYGVHTMTTGTPVINISGGTITAPVALKSSTNGGNGELATINVTGGTINGTLETYTDNGKIVVSGGTFSEAVAEEYCADGFVPAENADGTFGVTEFVPVAKVGDKEFSSFAEALEATKTMTGDVTVEIYDKVTFNQPLTGNYTSINFVGKDTDAEMYLDVQGYTTATGKKVSFTDLKLSKSEGGFIANAGFMNVAFGIYDVEEVTYNNCTFLNGACASSGKVTFNGCTFKKSWDKYGLWAYGNVDVTVQGSTFADYRGIKMYAENGAAESVEKANLTVKNTNFSAVTDKPAIVLTYGESVVLEGNTYSSTGTFELDLDGKPNGVAVTSDVAPVCVNDNGACGVLVDGKIYTTVAQAAEVATSGSTVTLLYSTDKTVVFAKGVELELAQGVVAPQVSVIPANQYTFAEFNAALYNVNGVFDGQGTAVVVLKDSERSYYNNKTAQFFLATNDGWNGQTAIETISIKGVTFRFEDDDLTNNFTSGELQVFSNDMAFEACTFIGTAVSPWGKKGDGNGCLNAAFTNCNWKDLQGRYGVHQNKASVLTVTGSTFENCERGIHTSSPLPTNITITGNTFTGIGDAYGVLCLSEQGDFSETVMNITGNTAEGQVFLRQLNTTTTYAQVAAILDTNNNVYGTSYVSNSIVPVLPVAKIGETKYETLEAAFAAAAEDATITLLADATPALTSQRAITKAAVIDLGGKTMTLTEDDLYFGTTTFKNGTIVVDPSVKPSTAVFWMFENQTLTFDNVAIVATGVTGTYLIGINGGTGTAVNLMNGSSITIDNESTAGLTAVICDNGTDNTVTIDKSVIAVKNIEGRFYLGGKNGDVSVKNTIITLNGVKEGFYLRAGQSLDIAGTSTVDITLNSTEGRYGINLTDRTATYTKAENATVNATVYEIKVAKIGETTYKSLIEAAAAVQDGETITLIADEIFTKTNRTHNSGTWYDGLYYVGDKSFTIDLGGFTISQDGAVNDYLLNFKNDGTKANEITLKNGTIDAGTTAFCAICTSSSQANDLTINTENINIINNISNGSTIKLRGGAVLNVKAGTVITGKDSYLGIECVASTVNIYDGAKIYMNGTSSYNGCLVGACAAGTVNVYGGYGKGVKGGFIAMTSGGTINVAGGEWIANTDGTVGNNSNFYVLTAQSNKNESGFAGPSIINVTGGTFRGGMDAWVLNNVEGEKAELNISGGNFNADPKNYVEDDYIAVKENDVWNVVKATAKIGTTKYTSLDAAFKAATSGCTIDILSDVTVDYAWDARKTGAKFTVPVTINGNGKTIKFTNSVNDNNYQAAFRFEADATVKNLIVDMSEVTDSRFRAISSKGNLTVDGCKFIGKDETLNCRAIIFGEGAGANVGNLAIAITNSEFINWKRGITDNENAQDVKTVTITGNTLTDAGVGVSAKETVTFTGNTVEGAYVDIRSYTANSSLNVTATGNTLEENTDTAYNYIKATGNIDQEGFKVYAVAKIGDVEYTTIEKAYAALQEGDEIVILKKGSYALKVKNNVTITGAVAGVEFANIGAFGCNGANVTFNNVTFTYAENSTYKGLQHSGNLVYNNCIFNGQVFLYGQSETFNGCTFNTTDSNNYNVWTYGAKEVAFNECTFNSAGKSVLIYAESASVTNDVTVTKCTFNASQAVEGKAAIEMDSSLTGGINLTIDGETTATGFAAGNVSGNSLWNNKKGQETEDNNDITVKVGDTVVLAPVTFVVKVGDNYYATLAEAFAAVGDGAGKTVELIADVDLAGAEWTPVTFNGTFDGNGKTISNLVVNGAGKSNQGFFAQTNNGEIKNVTFNNAKVTGRLNVGVVAGTPYTSKYTNVKVTGHVEVNGMAYVGGVGGKNAYADWTDITVDVDAESYVKANSVENGNAYRTYVGGVIGFNGEGAHTFKNISSNIKVIGSTCDVGGIFGIAHYGNNFENITFTGSVEAPADAEEVGGIAGVWHNEKGYTVTFTGCTSTGTVTVGDVTTTGSIVGGAYNADNATSATSGSLVIDGKEAWLPREVTTKAELDAAIAAAQEGDVILLAADIDYGTTQLAITKAITLDLGGKTLTTANAYGGMIIKGNPTIKNGNIVHKSNTAAIKVWNATAFEDLVIDVQGKGDANKTIGGIVLQSGSTTKVGSIKNVTIKGAALTNGIETYNCGDATENVIGAMENVTIDAQGTGLLISAPCGTATNCSIKGGVNAVEIFIKGNYSASLDLVASTVEGGVYAHDEFNNNPDIVNNGTLKFTADEATTGASAEDVTLTLARAEENVQGVLKEIVDNSQAKVNDTYYATLTEAIKAAKAGDVVTVFAGTYAMPSMKAGITIVGEGEVMFEGTLTGTLENLTMKNIHIKGGNAQRWAYAKGNLLFENVTFEATSVYALHFDGITEGTNLTYKNCTIIGWAALGGSPASCVFDGCTIKDNGTYGVIRTYFDTTIENCTFNVANANTTDAYQDGIHAVEGAKVVVENCTNANGDMEDLVNVHASSVVTVDGVEIKNVAKIGEKYYLTVAEAINAAAEGATVTVLTDIVLSETVIVPAGKTITLDLNGKTISQTKECTASYEMINNKGNLTITGEGKLSFKDTSAGDPSYGWGSYTVRNEGTLVVENGTIEHLGEQAAHMYCAIFQYSGKSTINGGTISTPNYRSARLWKGEMTVNGGNFEGQLWVQAVDNTSNLVINGGTFAPRGNDGSSVFVTNSTYDVALAVTGGTFDGKIGCSNATKLAGAITGGTFSATAKENTAAALIATGLTFGEADANGYYTIADDPATHYIATLDELKAFRDEVNSGANYYAGVTVYLAADIDMAGENWVGIGSATKDHGFMGNFDGNGYKFQNLTITNPALDSDGYAYAGLFAVTEGTDKDNQNTIKNLIIENVTITTTGHIAAAAIAYPYYTIVDNVKVCGNIAIEGGDYTAGVLAYTRRCVNASNLTIIGEDNSFVKGNQVVGGVISDIQMNGGLKADYKNFSAEGVTVTGTKNVGGISGIIATQTLDGATVKNVTLESNDAASAGIVSGALGGTSTISNVTFENVTGATALLGATYDGKAIEAKIGDTYYATLENALAAQGKATVELLVPFVVAADETVELNLNDKTVVATDNATGSYAMITNKGNLTINGEGAIQLTATNNRGWNAYSSVISNTVGGKLTVNGGTIEHLGGTDMAYAIDNLTNGKNTYAETVINGGTVKSTYRAVRQFLNGVEAQNILTVNGGTIEGANKSIWMQDPSKNANTGKLTVSADAELKGDVYLFVTAGSTEWPVEVSIANAAFVTGTVVTGNVPAQYAVTNVNGVWSNVNAVAAIDGVGYATLAAAINAAKAGETITLLQDVKENVTISKNLTIDGADNTITGMITTDGKSLKVTIKNAKFDGDNKTINYALRADDDLNLVVENCTVSNYIYGFLYANKSNDKIVVKNVTVENCAEYGAYLVSFNKATFENFTVKGATKYGIAVANAGARNVTLKNVSFENAETPLSINETGTGKVTFTFEGVNDMGKAEFYTSQYVNVVAAAQVGTKVCGSLQDAVVAANDGDTVKVIADVNMTTASFVTQVDGYATLVNVAGKTVTIDLNGKKVTVNAAHADLNGKAKGNMLMSVFHADPNGTLTLTDSSAEGTGTVELFANDALVYGLIVSENAYDKSNPGKIIVNGGNYKADRLSDSMIYADINEVITVNGGNFHLGNVGTGSNGKPWIFNAAGNNQIHINVNGGTYNANVAKQYWTNEVNLGEGLTTTNNGDGTWTVVPAVAAVGAEIFGSIQEAIDAAQDGETVKLIADVAYTDADAFGVEEKPYSTMLYVQGKNITLDMNGKKIDVTYTGSLLYSVVLVSDGAGLTVTGEGAINAVGCNADGTAAKNIAYMFWKRGTTGYLVIENGSFYMNDAADSMVYTNGDEIVTVNGGTFTLTAVASQANGWPVIFSTQGNNEKQIVVNGGTFNYDINHQQRPFEVYVAPEKALKKVQIDGVDMWTIVAAQAYVTEKLGDFVNATGDNEHNVGYATVAEAFAAAIEINNTTVTMVADAALTETVVVPAGKEVVLDLNGMTISAAITEQLTKSFAAIQNKGTLTVKDASTDADGKITVSYAGNSFGYGVGLYTISNEGGVLNIEGGTIENATTVDGSMYDAIDNNSTLGETVLNISGGEVVCGKYIGVRQFANNTTYDNIVNVTGGKVVGGNTSIWMQNPGSNQPKATIAISGADYENENYPVIEGRLLADESTGFNFEVTGGLFDTDVNAFCATDYASYNFGDGTWGVEYLVLDELTIADGVYGDFENQSNKRVGTLTYTRTLNNAWNALYVPFQIELTEELLANYDVAYINDVRSYDKDDNGELDTWDVEIIKIKGGMLKANHPYVIRPKKDEVKNLSITQYDVTLYSSAADKQTTITCSSAYTQYAIKGVYSKTLSSELNSGNYIYAVNKVGEWQKMGLTTSLVAFRLYLTITNTDGSPVVVDESAAQSMRMRLVGEEDEDGTTVIYDVEMDGEQSVDYIYDLQGRRVLEPQKGNLYIINGKKVIF